MEMDLLVEEKGGVCKVYHLFRPVGTFYYLLEIAEWRARWNLPYVRVVDNIIYRINLWLVARLFLQGSLSKINRGCEATGNKILTLPGIRTLTIEYDWQNESPADGENSFGRSILWRSGWTVCFQTVATRRIGVKNWFQLYLLRM